MLEQPSGNGDRGIAAVTFAELLARPNFTAGEFVGILHEIGDRDKHTAVRTPELAPAYVHGLSPMNDV
jgi:hypothetical protein